MITLQKDTGTTEKQVKTHKNSIINSACARYMRV